MSCPIIRRQCVYFNLWPARHTAPAETAREAGARLFTSAVAPPRTLWKTRPKTKNPGAFAPGAISNRVLLFGGLQGLRQRGAGGLHLVEIFPPRVAARVLRRQAGRRRGLESGLADPTLEPDIRQLSCSGMADGLIRCCAIRLPWLDRVAPWFIKV